MAVRTYTVTAITDAGSQVADKVVWTGLVNGDTGQPYERAYWSDRSIQVHGTFGAGGNLRLQGSNDGTNFYALTDPQGNDLDVTSAKIEAISEATLYIRPNVTAGDGSTSLTVTLAAIRKYKS